MVFQGSVKEGISYMLHSSKIGAPASAKTTTWTQPTPNMTFASFSVSVAVNDPIPVAKGDRDRTARTDMLRRACPRTSLVEDGRKTQSPAEAGAWKSKPARGASC